MTASVRRIWEGHSNGQQSHVLQNDIPCLGAGTTSPQRRYLQSAHRHCEECGTTQARLLFCVREPEWQTSGPPPWMLLSDVVLLDIPSARSNSSQLGIRKASIINTL